ncbi:hypothetical protein, partial [Corynebacterium sp. HMSC04H06]|uniref:hypothetical protein n=1 Tax=Corynebacterium sp. HMSC04H06 TaxID=1581050 RepID=UPI001AEFA565
LRIAATAAAPRTGAPRGSRRAQQSPRSGSVPSRRGRRVTDVIASFDDDAVEADKGEEDY